MNYITMVIVIMILFILITEFILKILNVKSENTLSGGFVSAGIGLVLPSFPSTLDNLMNLIGKSFSKMFCKSRDYWVNMPGGLLQTVLCDEKIQTSYDRLDEIFYYTMNGIKSRLENSIEVHNPTDSSLQLLTTDV